MPDRIFARVFSLPGMLAVMCGAHAPIFIYIDIDKPGPLAPLGFIVGIALAAAAIGFTRSALTEEHH